MNKTKIVSTIGPSSSNYEILKQMVLEGVSVFRINMAYSTFEDAKEIILNIRKLSFELKKEIGIMLDTRGPEIRLNGLEKPVIHLEKDKLITVVNNGIIGNSEIISIDEKDIISHISIGDEIFLNNGSVKLSVISKDEDILVCKIENDGDIVSESVVNLPNSSLTTEFLSEYDKRVIKFAVDMQIDFLTLSHVKEELDVLDANDLLISLNDNDIQIFSKIENKEALDEIDRILNVSDGIIISRGDLGIEMNVEKIPSLQKKLTKLIKEKEKVCIISTEILSSMKDNIRPTRAEVSDIANAVLDKVDALMLGEETAVGNYPVETVKVMSKTISEIESEIDYNDELIKLSKDKEINISKAISYSAVDSANIVNAKAIICSTLSGQTAKDISNYRPSSPIIAISPNSKIVRGLSINYGIIPASVGYAETTDELVDLSMKISKELLNLKENDKIVVVGSFPLKSVNYTNFMKIEEIK